MNDPVKDLVAAALIGAGIAVLAWAKFAMELYILRNPFK